MIKVIKPHTQNDLFGILEIEGINFMAQYIQGNYYIPARNVEKIIQALKDSYNK
jgi:hypothetical protein